jgi:cytochrome P450
MAALPRFAYFPFLGGPRQCIGNGFAMMEMQLVLATLLRRYRVRLGPGDMPTPEAYVTLRPRGGVPVRIERRRSAPASFGL